MGGINHYVSLSVIQTTDVYLCDDRYTSSESSPEHSKRQSLLVRWLYPFNAELSLSGKVLAGTRIPGAGKEGDDI